MKGISLDSSFIISLALNCMLELIDRLSEDLGFYIGRSVYTETIERALRGRRHKYQAIRILKRINEGKIKIYPIDKDELEYYIELANRIFLYGKKSVEIVHSGEVETVLIAKKLDLPLVGIDEKTMRLLIEDPMRLREIIESKTHRRIRVNKSALEEWEDMTRDIRVVRSADLFVYLFRKGYFKDIPMKKEILEGGLWALRFSGCSISEEEIEETISWLFPE